MDCAVSLLLCRQEEAFAAEDGVHLAHEQSAALSLFAADTLCVPDYNGEEKGHHNKIKHHNASSGKEAETTQRGQRVETSKSKGKCVGQRGDSDGWASVLHRFLDSNGGRLIQISLVDGIANDKHVINTDSNKQEGHQAMDTGSLATQVVAESKS